MQQQTMSLSALSWLIENVAKPIKHLTVMSMILDTEILRARRDAVLAMSKINWIIPTMSRQTLI